jgi:hypothetical protein
MRRPSSGFLHRNNCRKYERAGERLPPHCIQLSRRSSSMPGTTRGPGHFRFRSWVGFAQSSTRRSVWTLEAVRKEKTFRGFLRGSVESHLRSTTTSARRPAYKLKRAPKNRPLSSWRQLHLGPSNQGTRRRSTCRSPGDSEKNRTWVVSADSRRIAENLGRDRRE